MNYKKTITIMSVALLIGSGISCSNKTNSTDQQTDSIAKDSTDSVAKDSVANAPQEVKKEGVSEEEVIAFIEKMYNQKLYEGNKFLKKHCTKAMLKQLKNANEYEDGGYATWLFRSEAQDGPSNKYKIISVEPLGDDWYQYYFYDMGVKGKNKVKVVIDGTTIKFDKIVRIS